MIALFAVTLLALLGLAAWLDLSWRQIPNRLIGVVACLWVGGLIAGVAGPVGPSLLVAGGVLAVGMAIWRCGWLGGGDVKLIAALSLWAGPEHVAALLLATALSGGLLAVTMLTVGRLGRSHAVTLLQIQAGRFLPTAMPALAAPSPQCAPSLPYGVAVALGGCWLVHLLFA